jgi:methylmalonyl-CoA/ethylmalonyl-CoA epimerase
MAPCCSLTSLQALVSDRQSKRDILAQVTPQQAHPAPIFGIGQIAITVKQLDRAVAFYRDVLGLAFLFEAGQMAFFDCGGTRLMLGPSENRDSTWSSIIYYMTSDIQSSAELLTVRGVHFESPPRMIAKMPDHQLWMAFFRDSEGNLAALMSEVR